MIRVTAPPYPRLPIIVGITGHWDLLESALPEVQAAIGGVLDELLARFGSQLLVVTALADGADQLAGAEAAKRGIAVAAVSPMPLSDYRETMRSAAGLRGLDALWDDPCVVQRIELPLVSGVAEPARQAEMQYEQLGVLLARRSHILLALWNGQDPEKAAGRHGSPRALPGGTPHVVALRQGGERNEVSPGLMAGSPLFDRLAAQLETARSGPILQIVTPRQKDGGTCQGADGSPQLPGTLMWWSDLPASQTQLRWTTRAARDLETTWRWIWPSPGHDRAEVAPPAQWQQVPTEGLGPLIPAAFDRIVRAARLLDANAAEREASSPPSASYLCSDGQLPQAAPGVAWLRQLRDLYEAANGEADWAQRRLFGAWLPGMPWPNAAQRQRRPRIGALLFFALAVPLATFCFEMFTEYGHHWAWLAGYLLCLLAPLAFYVARAAHGDLQGRYQDLRAIAEGLRVQFFWAAAGLPLAVSDCYLRHQRGMLGWIRLALHGPGLAALSATAGASPDASFLRDRWISDQRQYFQTQSLRQDLAAARMKRGSRLAIVALIVLAVAIGAMVGLHGGHYPHPEPAWLAGVPLVALGTGPAIAAFFLIISESRAYEEHAHAYALATEVFAEAERQSETLPSTDVGAWRTLLLALGQEALTENAVWIATHRSRPVTSHVG